MDDIYWINLAEDMDYCWDISDIVMNFLFHKITCSSQEVILKVSSQEKDGCMDLVSWLATWLVGLLMSINTTSIELNEQ